MATELGWKSQSRLFRCPLLTSVARRWFVRRGLPDEFTITKPRAYRSVRPTAPDAVSHEIAMMLGSGQRKIQGCLCRKYSRRATNCKFRLYVSSLPGKRDFPLIGEARHPVGADRFSAGVADFPPSIVGS